MSSVNPLSIGRMMSADMSQLQRTEVAAEEFESYLVEMLVKEMRKTVPKGMFSSPTMDIFTEMMDKAIAREIAEAGGLGLAKSMFSKMEEGEGSKGSQIAQSLSPIVEKLQEKQRLPEKVKELVGKIPVSGRLTSKFGMRQHPILGVMRMHNGIDIAADKGSAIENVMDGKVIFAGKRGGYGNTVVVEHESGWTTMYAHCEKINVAVGDVVQKGENLATVGSTGLSTGPHLHFELQQNGKAIDPLKVFQWSFD